MKKIDPEENIRTSNLVQLIGSVIAKDLAAEDFIRLKIAVSSSFEKNGYCIVPVCFYGADAAAQIDQAIRCDTEEKARVEIIAFVQTSKRMHTADDGTSTADYYQDIVGTSIAFARNPLESAFALQGLGKVKAPSMNRFICFGRVVNTYATGLHENRQAYLTIKTWHNDHSNFPQVICRGARVGKIAREIHDNDYIAAIGEIRPMRVPYHKKMIIKPHLFVSDLQKIAEASVRHLNRVTATLGSDDIIFQNAAII